jgi:hypothetical protein
MQEAIDPYSAWLRLPPGPRPPDHYQLLGLAPFHADMATIAGSADHRMAYVRQHLNGPYSPVALHVINELAGARNLLLNPQAKAAYDAELYRRMQGAAAPQYAQMQMGTPTAYGAYAQPGYAQPGYAQQAEPSAPIVSVRSNRYAGRSKSSMSEVTLMILAVAVLAVVGVGGYFVWNMTRTTPDAHHKAVAKQTPSEVTPEAPKEVKTKRKEATPETHVTTKPKPPETSPTTETVQEPAAVKDALTAARIAIADRKFTAAEGHLEAAKRGALSHSAKEEIEHVRALLHYTKGYWDVVQQSWKNLTAGSELMINDETIVVVEVAPDKLIIRAAGQNREYTVQRMPFPVALTLGENWLTKSDPNSNLFLAAFHLSDYKGDRKKARQLLNQAAKAGLDVDGLLKELALAEKK